MKSSSQNRNFSGLFIMMAALCWSTCGVWVKSSAWSGLSIAVLRGAIAMVVYLFVLGRVRIRLTKIKVAIAVCYFMQSILYMCANKFTTAGSVTALQNTSPIYIIILNALVLKYRPRKPEIFTCIFLLLGILMTVSGGGMGGNLLGNALAMLSGVFYAAVFFFSGISQMDTLESLVLGNALYLPLLPVMFSDPAVTAGVSGWIFPVLCSLICGVFAWLFFRAGMKTCSPLQANFIAMLEPVASPLWTLVFLGEKMSVLSVAGCALVIVTLLVYNQTVQHQEKKKKLQQKAAG